MDDYKELIKELNKRGKYAGKTTYVYDLTKRAADAIEELLAEREYMLGKKK